MSACGSPLSSNRRIEPAVAVKASVRPGSTSVCLVVESGGSRCCSAAAGEPAYRRDRPVRPASGLLAPAAGRSTAAHPGRDAGHLEHQKANRETKRQQRQHAAAHDATPRMSVPYRLSSLFSSVSGGRIRPCGRDFKRKIAAAWMPIRKLGTPQLTVSQSCLTDPIAFAAVSRAAAAYLDKRSQGRIDDLRAHPPARASTSRDLRIAS